MAKLPALARARGRRAALLHEAAAQESFAFFGTVLNGQPKLDARWKRAIRHIDSALGEALGQLYVDRYFPPRHAREWRSWSSNVRAVYRERLQKVPWMSRTDAAGSGRRNSAVSRRRSARRRTRAITRPSRSSGTISCGNVERAAAFESRREMARIGQPVDRTEWGMTPPTVNAYFNPTMNEIVFPAGILQPPFFDPEMDDAVNYGATGGDDRPRDDARLRQRGAQVRRGGESPRLVDQGGRRASSRRARKSSWSNSTPTSRCPALHVNGKLTLAENIADLGGLSIAYEAMERALGDDPAKRQPIDGFTPEQRFFISYAQSWAAEERPEYVRKALTTDVHAPDAIRGYRAAAEHAAEFFAAFGIKPGARLWKPEKLRAVIW